MQLKHVLNVYPEVLRAAGVPPEDDTHVYSKILQLTLDPSPSWWVRMDRL